MGSIRDIARVGKAAAKADSSGIDGFIWFLGIFGCIVLFFIILKSYVRYKSNKIIKKKE